MSETAFARGVKDYFGPREDHPQYHVWLDYALTANERGAQVAEKLKEVSPSLAGKRHLDIGSGYGGVCVAVAREGAASVGLEIDERLLRLSLLNQEDHPQLQLDFRHQDVLDWEGIKKLGTFDLITCDNVIEHVEVPERLVAHIEALVAPGGVAYVTVPNAFSLGQVRADCHYGLFGITLLPPWEARRYAEPVLPRGASYGISTYSDYGGYRAMFEKYRLEPQLLNVLSASHDEVLGLLPQAEQILEELEGQVEKGEVPDDLAGPMRQAMHLHAEQVRSGIDFYRRCPPGSDREAVAAALVRDHREELWYFFLRHAHPAPERSFLERGLRRLRRPR